MRNDLRTHLYDIWSPQFGSIWRIENRLFRASSFAKEKDPHAFHPGLVIDETGSQDSFQTAPGTSRYFSKHLDVFQTRLKDRVGNFENAYFQLHLSVPIHKKTFYQECHRGWWATDSLEKSDIARLKHQLTLRLPYDTIYR
jgi:hypothetical protein